jgi:simple sugar transport system permease protein
LIAIIVGSIILLIQSKNPFDVFSLMLKLSIGSVNSLSNSLNKAIPLILAGLGIAIINSVKLWNIGAEGQIFFGAIALNFVYVNTSIENSYLYILLLLASGFIGGSVCIFLPAISKVLFGVNEIITTLLTNYIVFGLTIYLINGVWKDPNSLNFPAAAYVSESVYLPTVFGKLSSGFLICILFTLIAYYIKDKSVFGYEMRIAGGSTLTAVYAGISAKQKAFVAMLIGGGFAGLAGAIELLSQTHRVSTGISQGFGYTAIIVAAITGMRPLGIFLVGSLFGALAIGGSVIQTIGVSSYISDIIQATTLFGALIAQFFFSYQIKRVKDD